MAGEDFPFLKLLRLFGATCSATTAGQASYASFSSPASTAAAPDCLIFSKDNFSCWHVLCVSLLTCFVRPFDAARCLGTTSALLQLGFTAGLLLKQRPCVSFINPWHLRCLPLVRVRVHMCPKISLLSIRLSVSSLREHGPGGGLPCTMEWATCLVSESTGRCHTSQAFHVMNKYLFVYTNSVTFCLQLQSSSDIISSIILGNNVPFSSASSPQWSCTLVSHLYQNGQLCT